MAEHHSEDSGDEPQYIFRHIRTRKINFKVRSNRDVAICLSAAPENDAEMYEIFFGVEDGTFSCIRRDKIEEVLRMETPDILNEDDFSSFWIKINRGKIQVGKKGKLFPFMKFEDANNLQHIHYYGYATFSGSEGDWIFGDEKEDSSSSSSGASSSDSEAEDLNSMEVRPIMYKRPARWVHCGGGYMPHHPVSGGEGATGEVFVGMAPHEGGHILGMIVPDENLCYIPYGGEAIAKEEYYALGNPGGVELIWKGCSAGEVPSGALQGGLNEEGEILYIGRVLVDGVVSCGKVHPSHATCYVPYGGLEHSHRDYEVLCVKQLPCRIQI